ncbi:MAG TPA: von Willebrand factor type A domain-containing protein, partial [Thermoanaerobaculia bacterium]|nr:von Willebrand factor type A domain-containing protein [Thermoanaerobaculia bacterium]
MYKAVGTNPFTETAQDRLSTFGLDVDTGSYTVARRYIADGNLPDPRSVRLEEYVNYFNYGDPAPTRGDFAIRAEGAPSPFAPGANHRLLRFNIRGREIKAEHRRPVVMTFVVDVSGSMAEQNRLELVKQSLSLLLDQLTPRDRIGLVVYGDVARLVLEPTNNREAARSAIQSLHPEGATNAEAGLQLAYDVAGRNFRMDSSNRILLCSDGVANVGHTGPQAILGRIGREARRGIELSTLGFGMGNYNDHLMEQLADKGDGRYAYIDTLDEAKRVLVEEVTGALQTIAKNAKVQVDFNPAAVTRYRLLGYENRAIADERFRDNSVDAGEVGAGHSVTALYEV